jgi:hypothetical protein
VTVTTTATVVMDLVIEGARLLARDESWREERIWVQDDRIAEVGPGPFFARRTVVASGLLAVPGFVDLHNHSDLRIQRARRQARAPRYAERRDGRATPPWSFGLADRRGLLLPEPLEHRAHRISLPRAAVVPPVAEARGASKDHDAATRLADLEIGPARELATRVALFPFRRTHPARGLADELGELAPSRLVSRHGQVPPVKPAHGFVLFESVDEDVEQRGLASRLAGICHGFREGCTQLCPPRNTGGLGRQSCKRVSRRPVWGASSVPVDPRGDRWPMGGRVRWRFRASNAAGSGPPG